MRLLDKINNPNDLKKCNQKELEIICSEIRNHIIDCCASNPGHIGSNLGVVELTVATHYVFDTPNDSLVWDVGHQAYAHKIITGRRDAFVNNRKHKGISGFPKISESIYDAFGVGHASTSISAALGIAVAAEINNQEKEVIAIIGDGAMTGGLAFEALNNAGALKPNMLVILNDNQISIDKSAGALHQHLLRISTSSTYNNIKNRVWELVGSRKLRNIIQKFRFSTKMAIAKNGSLFESLGFRYFGPIDGHNLPLLISTLSSLKNINGPKLLHVVTTKGKGYRPAEENQVLWHAPGVFDPKTGKIPFAGKLTPRYQDVFGTTLLNLARHNQKIVGITPAMATGCGMDIMMKEMPERVFDVGIAEGHAVTFSAGLAANGLLPFCNIYSTFMQRGYDNVIHDVATQNLKVIFCLDRGGLVGEDGATHQGVFDLSYFRPIPNLIISSPLNELELKNLMYSATKPEYCSTIIRYPRGYGEGESWKDKDFEFIPVAKAKLMSEGEGIGILSLGPIGNKVQKAIKMAKNEGVNPIHYDMRFLKPIDFDALKDVSKRCHTIITIEDACTIGGLFSSVSEYISLNGLGTKVIPLGVPDKFIEQGCLNELYTECGYNTTDIFETIMSSSKGQ